MSSIPPPRGGLVKGDYVLVSGVWFEMMNSAPSRRPSAAASSISDFSSIERELPRGSGATTSSEIESRGRDRSAHSNGVVERDEVEALKPRPVQIRSTTARLTSYSSNKLQGNQSSIEIGEGLTVEVGGRDMNEKRSASRDEQKYRIPKPGYHAGCSTCASTSDLADSEGGTNKVSKASKKGNVGSGSRGRSECRNGHALVNGVYHQMSKPGASAPRPRNKLQKTQKGVKNRRDGSVGEGSRGPRLVVP